MRYYCVKTYTPYINENFYYYYALNDDERIEDYEEDILQFVADTACEFWDAEASNDFDDNYEQYLEECGVDITEITEEIYNQDK